MSKKLIAVAVGAALGLSPLAASAAKVTVYGHAQVEISSLDNGSTSDGTNVSDEARGRFGIKASEKLGNGMKALAKFEFRTDTADNLKGTSGEDELGPRESYVGLKGSFGTVLLGRNKSAYKYSGGVKYDIFVATTLEARGRGGMSKGDLGNGAFGHSSFISNSISYKSPNMNGFSLWAQYSPDEVSPNSAGGDGDYAASIDYKNGPLNAGVAFVNNDDASGGDAWKIYGSYKFGNHKILGQYEKLDRAASTDIKYYFLAWQMRSGNNTFVAQLGNKDVSGGAETDYYTIGLVHHLSKKTRLFGGFSNTDPDGGQETDIVSVGLRMIF
jgi:predicted porin